jgi:hypothetical protein
LNNPQIVSSVIGLIIATVIFLLVRKDHLLPGQAFRWFFIALAVAVIGLYPKMIDHIGIFLGIAYPPIIPLIIALGAALIKILLMDIQYNRMQVTQDRIVQKLAMFEAELKQFEQKSEQTKNNK